MLGALASLGACGDAPRDTTQGGPESDASRPRGAPAALPAEIAQRVARNPPLPPVPPDPTNRWSDDPIAAELGHRIFFDPRFSASGTVSCATCHQPGHGFADARPIARGEGTGTRRSMSVLNAAHNRWFTWDGRADTLWSQALQPLETPHEHGTTREAVVATVGADPVLRALYERAFGEPPAAGAAGAALDATFARIGKAIAAYERRLVTGPSAYDRWWTRHHAGDPDADQELTPAARRGLELFFGRAQCWECHHGANFTDGEFHVIGVPSRAGGMPTDPGRYAVVEGVRDNPFNAAGPHSDDPAGRQARISAALVRFPELWGQVKTPSLRAAALAGPYMHQGQFETLEEVVRFYSTLEGAVTLDHHRELVLRRLDLSPEEQADLVAFLRAIAGTPPGPPWGEPPQPAHEPPVGAAP
jgi:cytochrome c peroxidase